MDSVVRAFCRFRAWVLSRSRLGEEQHLAGGLPAFQVLVGLGCFCQRVGGADPDGQRAVGGGVENFCGTPAPFVGVLDKVAHRGTRQGERTSGVEPLGIERWNGPGSRSEQHHGAADPQASQGIVESVLADAVVHHIHALTVGEFPYLVRKTLVAQDLIGSRKPGKFGFFVRRNGGDDPGSACLQQLGQQEPDATGACVEQNGVSRFHSE